MGVTGNTLSALRRPWRRFLAKLGAQAVRHLPDEAKQLLRGQGLGRAWANTSARFCRGLFSILLPPWRGLDKHIERMKPASPCGKPKRGVPPDGTAELAASASGHSCSSPGGT